MNLLGSDRPPIASHDVALLDLDGVVYIGDHAVAGAVDSLDRAAAAGMGLAFVTNNASRPPHVVAEHLRELGLAASPSQVVTSAQAGARLMAAQVPPGAEVLAVGGEGVVLALREAGLSPVRRHTPKTSGVLQGFGREVSWLDLADAALAVRSGVPWIATNPDRTVPIPGGIGPGNGALVAAVAMAAGRDPDAIAGKPYPALMDESIRRSGAERPIVVGDRLDTDIEGARATGVPSMLVLTGVSTPTILLAAAPDSRPDLLAWDLAGLLMPHEPVRAVGERSWSVDGITVDNRGGSLIVAPDGILDEPNVASVVAALRCACVAAWADPTVDAAGIAGMLDDAVAGLLARGVTGTVVAGSGGTAMGTDPSGDPSGDPSFDPSFGPMDDREEW